MGRLKIPIVVVLRRMMVTVEEWMGGEWATTEKF
jgi:hypothetical protein